MFNKKDPLIDSVKNIMKENEVRREAERKLNEELGIASKKALPFEHHANYDALLEQKIAEALHPNQQKLDVHEPEKDELTAQDFKMLRAKKKPMKEEDDKSVQGSGAVTKDGKDVVSSTAPKAEGPTDKERAAMTNKVKEVMKEAIELDESVSATHYKDADGNKTWDVSHKKKKIGSITVDKKGSWSYEHEPSGNYEDGYESKREAVKELKDTHKYHEKIMKDGTLEEASRKTLHSYINKAIDKVKSGEEPEGKRAKGLRKATTKLYKVDEENIEEKAPPGAKFERMVKHIKKKYAKDGLTKQEKSIAYATAWKAKNKEEMKESIEAELKKNLGEKFDEIMEGMPAGGYMGQKHAASTYNDLQKDTNATDEKPSVNIKAAQGTYSQLEEEDDELDKSVKSASSLTSRSSDNNSPSGRAAGMGAETGNDERTQPKPTPTPNVSNLPKQDTTSNSGEKPAAPAAKPPSMTQGPGGGLTPQGSSVSKPSPAAPAPKTSAASPSGRENVPGPNDRANAAPRPAARPATSAPKPAAPAAKPAAQAPVGGPGAGEGEDSSSPLAALRQYNAAKEAGAFDNKSTAPAAKPAAKPAAARPAAPKISAPTGSAPGTPASRSMAPSGFKPTAPSQRMARGGVMAESLEETIKKIIKE